MAKNPADIPSEEGYLVEFKDFSGGVSNKELSVTMCAFANTDGGDIYIGVTDTRQIKGLKITSFLLDNIQNTAREGCVPAVHIGLHQIKIDQAHSVIKISVEKSGHLHSTASGKTYIRIGTQDKKVMGDELLRLAETKSRVSFEETLLDVGTDVLDVEAINQYYTIRQKVSSIRRGLSHEELLMKIGLAEKRGNAVRIKAGAFILFGRENEAALLQRDFAFVKYDKENEMYTYRDDLSLPATKMLDRLMELVRPYNKSVEGTKGLVRQEKFTYPEESIREALLNAFAHRDYRIAGLKNECRIYSDRMEIISAGGLPGMITLENIDKRHYSRNPKIMHALLILGLTEELGQGITLMKEALNRNGNPPPEFVANEEQFKVIFHRAKKYMSGSDAKLILEKYFAKGDLINRSQIESLTGFGKTRTKYFIKELLKEDYLEKIGNGPSTKYKKKQATRPNVKE